MTKIKTYRVFANPVVRYLSTFYLDGKFKGVSGLSRKIQNIQLKNIILAYYLYGYKYVDGTDGIDYFITTSTQLSQI